MFGRSVIQYDAGDAVRDDIIQVSYVKYYRHYSKGNHKSSEEFLGGSNVIRVTFKTSL